MYTYIYGSNIVGVERSYIIWGGLWRDPRLSSNIVDIAHISVDGPNPGDARYKWYMGLGLFLNMITILHLIS